MKLELPALSRPGEFSCLRLPCSGVTDASCYASLYLFIFVWGRGLCAESFTTEPASKAEVLQNCPGLAVLGHKG